MSGVIDKENTLKNHVLQMEDTVNSLESSLTNSCQVDSKVMLSLYKHTVTYEEISDQLKGALKENEQLLNIMQQKCSDEVDVSRGNSQNDLSSSCSTMSIVHLQYKYEELLASHRGLLRLLELRSDEIKKMNEENNHRKLEFEEMKESLTQSLEKGARLKEKFNRMKERKTAKINRLKEHKETMMLVHNQLVSLLHRQFLEKDQSLSEEIRCCIDSEKALLLQEIRKNNLLAYENFQLSQKIEHLKSFVDSG